MLAQAICPHIALHDEARASHDGRPPHRQAALVPRVGVEQGERRGHGWPGQWHNQRLAMRDLNSEHICRLHLGRTIFDGIIGYDAPAPRMMPRRSSSARLGPSTSRLSSAVTSARAAL